MPEPNATRFRSGQRNWQINKKADHQGVIIDWEKKTISYDKNRYWIRTPEDGKFYIYSIIEGSKA